MSRSLGSTLGLCMSVVEDPKKDQRRTVYVLRKTSTFVNFGTMYILWMTSKFGAIYMLRKSQIWTVYMLWMNSKLGTVHMLRKGKNRDYVYVDKTQKRSTSVIKSWFVISLKR